MITTFNCGIGFCIITKKNILVKYKKYFSKKFKPYQIGYISKNNKKINISNSLKW